jgi:putative transcriptional regulator
MRLGNNVRRYRFDREELSQQRLAEAISVTRQTIFAIEKGRFIPSTLLALRIARFFGKPVEELFYIIENEDTE